MAVRESFFSSHLILFTIISSLVYSTFISKRDMRLKGLKTRLIQIIN
ncbi:MAG: hypothetical protein RL092_2043 [Bacteroidota bacterium]|jgi:hypothetical protein